MKGLVNSQYWDTLVEHLKEREVKTLTRLRTCSPEELRKLQGQLEELNHLLDLKANTNIDGKQ
jgi:IS5 family transposase